MVLGTRGGSRRDRRPKMTPSWREMGRRSLRWAGRRGWMMAHVRGCMGQYPYPRRTLRVFSLWWWWWWCSHLWTRSRGHENQAACCGLTFRCGNYNIIIGGEIWLRYSPRWDRVSVLMSCVGANVMQLSEHLQPRGRDTHQIRNVY